MAKEKVVVKHLPAIHPSNSKPLTATTLLIVLIGTLLPISPLAKVLQASHHCEWPTSSLSEFPS